MSLASLAHLATTYTAPVPEDTWREYRALIDSAIDSTPRSLQTRIGPSELGVGCDACLISKLAGIPEHREPGDSWLPFIGTSVHEQLANIFTQANTGLERARYLVEMTVNVGTIGGEEITGHADLYDTWTHEVTDWKVVGAKTLRDAHREGPSETYRVQAHLYGYGFVRRGLPVSNVRIAFLPRNSRTLADALIWLEPFDQDIAVRALNRADDFSTWIQSYGIVQLLNSTTHTGGHSCKRYGWTDPDTDKRASAAFNDILA